MREKDEAEGGAGAPRSPEGDAEAIANVTGIPAEVRPSVKALAWQLLLAREKAAREATMDEFGILHGEAAAAFLAEMDRPRSPAELADREKFLKECDRVYAESKVKMGQPGKP